MFAYFNEANAKGTTPSAVYARRTLVGTLQLSRVRRIELWVGYPIRACSAMLRRKAAAFWREKLPIVNPNSKMQRG